MCSNTYLWCPNILSCSQDSSCLYPALTIEPFIPSIFDQALQFQYRWQPVPESFVAFSLGGADVRDQHLDVAIAAQVAFPQRLTDVLHRRMTKTGCFNGAILVAEFSKDLD